MNENDILLSNYQKGFYQLKEILDTVSTEEMNYFLDYKDSWSIKEHVIHLVDSELNGFIRLKSIIAQPGSDCYVMNEDDWTRNIRRKKEDITKYMNLYKLIREISSDFIKDENQLNWENQYFIRTYKGNTVKITIKEWLRTYNNHLQFHTEYIEKIVQEMKMGKNL